MNAATLRVLKDKGLSIEDIIAVADAMESKTDRTAAERQARYRSKRKANDSHAVTSRRFPLKEENQNPGSDDLPDGKSQNAAPWSKPAFCESDQIWADFLKNRKRKRLPNTETAYAGFLADVERIADDEWPPGRLLTHAATKGWGGIYDPRERTNGSENGTGQRPTYGASTRELAEQVARAGF